MRTILIAALAAATLLAQDRGTLRGTVTDVSGSAVPGAKITIARPGSGFTQSAMSGDDGVYSFLYLTAGQYTVTTEKTGFKRTEIPAVIVNVASVTTIDVSLTVGAVEQTVEVTAAPPILDTQGANLGKVMTARNIKDLPLFISGGIRANLAFVILTPGVIGPANNPRIGGGLLDGQSEQLDGAEAQSERRNDPAMNGVSVEGMQEFKVQSSGYSAEFGRTSNGVINWVTKSGTNNLHGSAFLFNRNEMFNARGFTFVPTRRPIVRQWNPGGSLGGPVYIPKVFDGRNKAFFFFAFERARTRNGQSTALVNAPVEEYINGDMRRNVDSAGRTIPLYDPIGPDGRIIANAADRQRMQCRGVLDVICPERIDPTAKLLMSLLPRPDDPTRIINNYRSRSFSQSKQTLPSIKFDYAFNDKHRVSYLYSRFFAPAFPSINALEGLPGTGFPSEVKTVYHRLNDDYVISANLLNHLTIGFNQRNIIEAPDYVSRFPAELARQTYIPGTVTPLIPGTSSTYSTSFATWGNSVFTDSRGRTINIKEQLAWIKGAHSIKFGFEYLKGHYRRLDRNGAFGTVSFAAAGTGNPNIANSGSDWASFLLGLASGGGFRYPSDTTFQWPYFAWYVQDDYKVTKRLTINIGLRYEIPIPKKERNLRNSNFCLECPNAAAGGLPGAMVYAGRDGQPERFGDTRWNAIGPRLGVAYQLNSKTLLRTGSAIYYQPSREDGNADNGIQGFGGTFGAVGNFLSNGVSYRVRDGFTPFAEQIRALQPPISDPQTLSRNLLQQTPFFYFKGAGRAPYFADWNFTVERTMTQSSVVRASYHGVVGVKMLSRQQTLNQLDPKHWSTYGALLGQPVSSVLTNPTVVAAGFRLPYADFPRNLQLQQALRPYPQFAGVNSNAGGLNDGHSTFHALETSFEHRFDKGFFMMVSYTFCKLISTTNGEDANRTSDGAAQNQYNRALDKAVANQDTPHNLRISYVYELPVGRGRRLLRNSSRVVDGVLGGWKVSAIHTYVAGTPEQITCGQNFFGAGQNARCSYAPGVAEGRVPLINPEWSKDKSVAFRVPKYNKAAFVLPPNMVFGDTPRRISYLRTPWSVNEDVALLKDFSIREGLGLEIRASASNVLNRALLASPVTAQNNVAFGMITNAQGNGPRNVQLGARVSF